MVESGCAKSHNREEEKFSELKQLPLAKNKSRYVSDKKKAKRAVADARKKDAVKEMERKQNDRNVVFRKMRMVKKKASDLAKNNCIKVEGRECGRSTWKSS